MHYLSSPEPSTLIGYSTPSTRLKISIWYITTTTMTTDRYPLMSAENKARYTRLDNPWIHPFYTPSSSSSKAFTHQWLQLSSAAAPLAASVFTTDDNVGKSSSPTTNSLAAWQ